MLGSHQKRSRILSNYWIKTIEIKCCRIPIYRQVLICLLAKANADVSNRKTKLMNRAIEQVAEKVVSHLTKGGVALKSTRSIYEIKYEACNFNFPSSV